MKKSFLISIIFAVLLSSCSNLNKTPNQEISVSIDTKPLAKYAKILFSEGSESIEVPRQEPSQEPVQQPSQEPEPETPKEDEPEKNIDPIFMLIESSFDAFKIQVTLSGDFTENIVKEQIITFDELFEIDDENPDNQENKKTQTFSFQDLSFLEGTKAKISAEIFLINVEDESDYNVSGSLFYGESEKELTAGTNTFPIQLEYKISSWPAEGPLSVLPQIENLWFYTSPRNLEYNWFLWRVYTTKEIKSEIVIEDYEESLKNEFSKYTGISKDLYDIDINPYNNVFEIVFFYMDKKTTEEVSFNITSQTENFELIPHIEDETITLIIPENAENIRWQLDGEMLEIEDTTFNLSFDEIAYGNHEVFVFYVSDGEEHSGTAVISKNK